MTTSKNDLVQEKRFDNGKKIAVLMLSGGIDSTSVAYKLLADDKFDQYIAFFVNLGVSSTVEEYNSANRTCTALGLRLIEADFSWYRRALGGVLPAFENDPRRVHPMLSEQSRKSMSLVTAAAVYAETIGSFDLFHGINKDDLERYRFAPNVFKHIEECMTLGNIDRTFTIHTPWIDLTSDQVIQEASSLHVPLENTWSCWSSEGIHCGVCGGCASRKAKFMKLAESGSSVVDVVEYKS